MPMTEQELVARDAGREVGAELVQAVRDVQAGRWARKIGGNPGTPGTVQAVGIFG